jgi:protein-arginine kinase activator protein McsA
MSVLEAAGFLPSDETEAVELSGLNLESEKSKKKPQTKEARLATMQSKLREAIDTEEYERAAKIRDDIKKLTSDN